MNETIEEREIREAVEQRKQRARDIGIVDQVFRLYQEHLRYEKSKEICVNGRLYSVSFSEQMTSVPGEYWSTGSLSVKSDGALLLEIKCMEEDDKYMGFVWKAFDVGAFLEGPWVDDISQFAVQVFQRKEQDTAKHEGERRKRETEELKIKFGL